MENFMENMTKARNLLDSGDYTCVVCNGNAIYTTTQRGVAPLLNWLDSGTDLTNFSAADRVVGRGAAFLYCLKGVSFSAFPFGLPEIIGCALVILLHVWKRNTLLSIGAGTVCYMLLVQFVF